MSSDDSFSEDEFLPTGAPAAASIMHKMGYSAGRGLGASEQGIVVPVEAVQRPKLEGIGRPERETENENEAAARIDKELALLRTARAFISPDADLAAFVRALLGSPAWQEFGLADAAAAIFVHQVSALSLPEIEARIDVFACCAALPAETWESMLQKAWVPKLCVHSQWQLAHIELLAPYVKPVLAQLLHSIADFSFDAPGIQQLCRIFGSPNVYAEFAARDVSTRADAATIASAFPNTSLSRAAGSRDGSHDGSHEAVVEEIERIWLATPRTRSDVLQFVTGPFLATARERAVAGTLRAEWYLAWRDRVQPFDVDKGLHGVLVAINLALDARAPLPPFSAVLEQHCARHELVLTYKAGEYTVEGASTVHCFIDRDVLYCRFGAESVPISLTDLDNLVQ